MSKSPQLFLIATVLALACSASLVRAQNPAAAVLGPASAPATEQVQKPTRRLTLSVVVSDKSGKPVGGLDPADFVVLDNTLQRSATVHALTGHSTRPPTEVVLLFDALNATFQDVLLERQGIDKYLRQNGGRLPLPVSIVFLSDTGVQLAAASTDGNALADNLAKLKSPIRMHDTAQSFNGLQERQQRSVAALMQLSKYEATTPGRKLLVWVGPGWPLLSAHSSTLNAENKARYFSTIVTLNTELRRAQITLYSVIPLNLVQGNDAQGNDLRSFLYQDFLKGVDGPQHADSPNLGLQVLATQSGGQVLEKDGNLAGQISRCVEDADAYYELSFDAVPAEHADAYHKPEVHVNKPGLSARTTTGYYAQP